MNKHAQYLDAARKALRQRHELEIAATHPVSVIDAAHLMGLQVWFRDNKSYDGYYSPGAPPLIVLSALRPYGRIQFTCAHEIGHHVYGHGERCDVNVEHAVSDEQEWLANSFAIHFLMPRQLIRHALEVRAVQIAKLHPRDVLAISSWLGVGYSTFIRHLCYQLKLIGAVQADTLLQQQPKRIKEKLLGTPAGRANFFYVDRHWSHRPIDCYIDDYICFESEVFLAKGYLSEIVHTSYGYIYQAKIVGLDCCTSSYGQLAIRISRGRRTVRAIYMYDEEEP